MTSLKPDLERAAKKVSEQFPTFGGDQVPGNPIAHALAGKPQVFALGVSVSDVVRAALLAWYSRTPSEKEVEAVAIALSLADPDERGLPEGERMAPFYRKLVRAVYEAQARFVRKELEMSEQERHYFDPIKREYAIGDTVWLHLSGHDGKLVGGEIVHVFRLSGWPDEDHYVIEIETGIDPMLEVRDWVSLSQDAAGPIGLWRLVAQDKPLKLAPVRP